MTKQAAILYRSRSLSHIEKLGLIKTFEFTFELACKVMKDYLIYQGNTEIMGSRDAIRQAFSLGLISDGKTWMAMIDSRNLTSHTYDEKTVEKILEQIADEYYPLFVEFQEKMSHLANKD